MAADSERATVEALARQIVAEVSPAELPLFRATADSYFADPDGALAVRGRKDEALGFGAETVVALVGPFALDLVRRVLGRLVDRLGDVVADAVAERVLRRTTTEGGGVASAGPASGSSGTNAGGSGGSAASGPEPLDPSQLALVRQVADEEARRLQLPPDRAQRLADALVASIATRG
jgi:hypothetical protein